MPGGSQSPVHCPPEVPRSSTRDAEGFRDTILDVRGSGDLSVGPQARDQRRGHSHGVEHALVVADEQATSKVLYLGPDRAGNLLEIVSVLRDDDTEIVIHAMRMRWIYEPQLHGMAESDG